MRTRHDPHHDHFTWDQIVLMITVEAGNEVDAYIEENGGVADPATLQSMTLEEIRDQVAARIFERLIDDEANALAIHALRLIAEESAKEILENLR